MSAPDHDPAIENEPHLKKSAFRPDPSEEKARRLLEAESQSPDADNQIDHSVWDEPALSPELIGTPPKRGENYAQWLNWRVKTTSAGRTWGTTCLIILSAGPWAVLGALLRSAATSGWGIVAITAVGPATEEIMKIALVLWVVEKRVYLFRRPLQIFLCCLAGGLAFAAIENAMYLLVYIKNPPAGVVAIRWTVCVAMHVGCSLLAGVGVARVWSRSIHQRARPRIARALPWIVAAIIVHGSYNAVAVLAGLAGWLPK